MVTGLRSVSFENLVLNEGAFIMGLKPSTYNTYSALVEAIEAELGATSTNILGATSGGGTFVCAPETRTIEIDGLRGLLKGASQIDSWDVRLTGTLKEIRPEVFAKLCIGGTVDSTVAGVKKITVHSDIKNDDYIADMCWVGSTSKGMMLIHLTNVLNTVGVTMTFQDKGEATVPFEFVAHNENATGDANIPCDIYFLEDHESGDGE